MQVTQADVAHEADVSTPLHHGILRYEPVETLPAKIKNSLPAKNDRPFVYVPVGYLHREERAMKRILDAMGFDKLPNMCVVTAETTDAEDTFSVLHAEKHPIAKDWKEEHAKEVLQAKTGLLLESIVESAIGVGAWMLPDSPRRRNAAAQRICNAFPLADRKTCVALGLIGLNEDSEEDANLSDCLQATMVPIGSPVRSVSKIVFDPDLKDGAPCPQLTHILVFETAEEKMLFRQALLDAVPDFVLGFGDITTAGMNRVFENVKDGSPVVMLKHTGSNADKLARMFRHVKKVMASSTDVDAGLNRLPPVKGEDDELIKLFVNTWPLGFQSDSIVVADPLLTTPPDLQQRLLGAFMTCFGLKTGRSKTRVIKRKALDYAWSFYNAAREHVARKKKNAELLHIQLVVFTLLSIVASVYYNQVFGGEGHPDDSIQMIAYVSTIILPLYVTSLKQESDKGDAVARWGAFEVAAIRIHSEIYKFRTQVGPYRIAEKKEAAHQVAVAGFTTKIREIWLSVKPHMQEDGMAIPNDFWDFNPAILSSAPSSFTNLQELAQKHEREVESKILSSAPSSFTDLQGLAKNQEPEVVFNLDVAAGDAIENAKETTPLLEKAAHGIKAPLAGAAKLLGGRAKDKAHEDAVGGAIDPAADDDEDSDDDEESAPQLDKTFDEDGYKSMKVQDYLDTRMRQEMNRKAEEVQKMASRNQKLSRSIKFITMFSGATAALSLQWFVPIVLAVTAALSTGQEFRRYPQRIEIGNDLVIGLNKLKLWWMGLSMYEKQLPHHQDRLVLTSESIIVAELESAFVTKSASSSDED